MTMSFLTPLLQFYSDSSRCVELYLNIKEVRSQTQHFNIFFLYNSSRCGTSR